MLFFVQIRPDRQTLLWSATWPKEVEQLARQFLYNAYKVILPLIKWKFGTINHLQVFVACKNWVPPHDWFCWVDAKKIKHWGEFESMAFRYWYESCCFRTFCHHSMHPKINKEEYIIWDLDLRHYYLWKNVLVFSRVLRDWICLLVPEDIVTDM